MKSFRFNALSLFMLLVSLLVFSAQPAFCFDLKSKVQDEIDQNPFLQKEGVKLKVTDEKNGYLTIEMYEGNSKIRKYIHDGYKVSQFDTTSSDKTFNEPAVALQLTMDALQKIEGVKSIMLTAAIEVG